jgi:carbon-monoxide dehydrogenase medium subunit
MKAGLMQAWDSYVLAQSVDEALEGLQAWTGGARVIAGGTDLTIDLATGRKSTKHAIDVTRIPELCGINALPEGGIAIGAATTHAEVAASDLIRRRCSVLAEAADSVGSLQIRNQGTIGGNLVNAQPAADAAVALAALDATVEIAGPDIAERRTVPWQDIYTEDVGQSRVDSTRELVTQIFLSSRAGGSGSSFQRLARRRALALPMLNCAVVLEVETGQISWCRITMGPVATIPFRCSEAEAILTGLAVDDEAGQRAAAEAVTAQVCPRDSLLRGSADYRCIVAGNLAYRGIQVALERSGNGS